MYIFYITHAESTSAKLAKVFTCKISEKEYRITGKKKSFLFSGGLFIIMFCSVQNTNGRPSMNNRYLTSPRRIDEPVQVACSC